MAGSDFSAVAEIVPQASYELIGRLIPGIAIMLSLVVAAKGPLNAWEFLDELVIRRTSELSGSGIVALVVAAYILAIVLDGVWQIPACIRRRAGKMAPLDLKGSSASLKFDRVNSEMPKAGAWLTKLYAETNALQVLTSGWVVAAMINFYYLRTQFFAERLWLEGLLIMAIIGALAARDSIATTRNISLENLWLLLPPVETRSGAASEAEHR